VKTKTSAHQTGPAHPLRTGLRILRTTFVLILLAVVSFSAGESKDGFLNFYQLSKHEAATTARTQAVADFEAGRYRILVFGLRASAGDRRFEKYGAEVKPIAGCIVSEGIIEGARAYNEVIRGKLKAKLGCDIFEKTEKPEIEPAK
jgi:hypothetical protein